MTSSSRKGPTLSSRLSEAEDLAAQAARAEHAADHSSAFALYVRAAEVYLALLRAVTDKPTKARLKERWRRVVGRAEALKGLKAVGEVRRERTSADEQDLALYKSALINSHRYPIFSPPPPTLFSAPSTPSLYSDPRPPSLSPAQLAQGGTYVRALSFSPVWLDESQGGADDVVQDVATDCSVVAALSVCAAHNHRFGGKLAIDCLYPQDPRGLPIRSESGGYLVRLLINGAHRSIEIDDRLPTYPDGRLMTATPRAGTEIWPALLEKAYMKLMGGYDFPGSNSSIDLHALTGWIPEHVSLQDTSFKREQTWLRIHNGFRHGTCLVSLGTGKNLDALLERKGFITSHDYAVQDVREEDGRRIVRVANPWRSQGGPVHADGWTYDLRAVLEDGTQREGVFDLSWDEVCDFFDALYLNWDPDIFIHSTSVHATHKVSTTSSSYLDRNPQFRLSFSSPSASSSSPLELWILLTRHTASKKSDGDWLSALHVFETDGTDGADDGVQRDKGVGGDVLTDSPHILVRVTTRSSTAPFALVVSHRRAEPSSEGEDPEIGYTLSAYSSVPLTISDPPHRFPYTQQVDGAWTSRTAGGNPTFPTFHINPQCRLNIRPPTVRGPQTAALRCTVETAGDVPVNVKLVWGEGKRVYNFADGDALADSGKYTHSLALLEKSGVSPGTYTLVPSTFTPGRLAAFTLHLECTLPFDLDPIPAEGAGMFALTARGEWTEHTAGGAPRFGRYGDNPKLGLKLKSSGLVRIRLQQTSSSAPLPLNVSLFRPLPSYSAHSRPEAPIATSGPYSDARAGALVEDVHLEAGTYTVVMSAYAQGVGVGERWALSIWTERAGAELVEVGE